MSKGEKICAVVAGLALVALLVFAGSARAQTGLPEGSAPKFVAASPSPDSWIPCWNTAGTDTLRGVALLSVSANTDTRFSCWWWRSAKLPHKVKWPVYGPAASDTTYFVGAGQTLTFRFPKPWVQYLVVDYGDAIFQGE